MDLFDEALPERFWEKVQPEPNSGCWLWLAGLDRYGYGKYYQDGRTVQAHAVPKGQTGTRECHWDHRCRVRSCVNPNHTELVTYLENQRRGLEARKK